MEPPSRRCLRPSSIRLLGDRIGVAVFRRTQPNACGLDLLTDFGREALPHQFLGKVRRRCDQHKRLQRGAGGRTPGEFARQEQRHPPAHRGTDHHLRAGAKLLEDRNTFFQPLADGAVGEIPAGFTMAGIVEPNAGTVVFRSPSVQRQGLGALHVRLEAAEPEKPGGRPLPDTDSDTAGRGRLADFDKKRVLRACRGAGHGIVIARPDRARQPKRGQCRPFEVPALQAANSFQELQMESGMESLVAEAGTNFGK